MVYDLVLDQLRVGEGLTAQEISMKLRDFEENLESMSRQLSVRMEQTILRNSD